MDSLLAGVLRGLVQQAQDKNDGPCPVDGVNCTADAEVAIIRRARLRIKLLGKRVVAAAEAVAEHSDAPQADVLMAATGELRGALLALEAEYRSATEAAQRIEAHVAAAEKASREKRSLAAVAAVPSGVQ